jgi:hypothetical protein
MLGDGWGRKPGMPTDSPKPSILELKRDDNRPPILRTTVRQLVQYHSPLKKQHNIQASGGYPWTRLLDETASKRRLPEFMPSQSQ